MLSSLSAQCFCCLDTIAQQSISTFGPVHIVCAVVSTWAATWWTAKPSSPVVTGHTLFPAVVEEEPEDSFTESDFWRLSVAQAQGPVERPRTSKRTRRRRTSPTTTTTTLSADCLCGGSLISSWLLIAGVAIFVWEFFRSIWKIVSGLAQDCSRLLKIARAHALAFVVLCDKTLFS